MKSSAFQSARTAVAVAFATIAALTAALTDAKAQSISSGASPTLRGTLAEIPKAAKRDEDGVSQTVVVGVSGGYTNNAGPTFDETSSPVIETSAFVLHARPLGEGRLSLQADLTDREFTSQSEARNAQFGVQANFALDSAGISLTLAAARSVEIDEKITQTSLKVDREWRTESDRLTPFWSGSLAYLDYTDIDQVFVEFANQDDRDRLSASSQAGVKLQISEPFSLTAALGVDAKKYVASRDDFLLDRDNQSAFASAGIAYEDKGVSASLTYAPVARLYDETLFRPLFTNTFLAQATLTPTDWISASATARYGLEETDFLDARVMKEFVGIAGFTVTLPDRSSATLEGAYTHRYFDTVDRIDQKYEIQVRAQKPITDAIKLTAQVGYLLFATNIGDLSTDQTTAMLGIVTTID